MQGRKGDADVENGLAAQRGRERVVGKRWRPHLYPVRSKRQGWRAAAEQRRSPVWGCVMAWRDGMRGREGSWEGGECVWNYD